VVVTQTGRNKRVAVTAVPRLVERCPAPVLHLR
jgi:hypothetical protein